MAWQERAACRDADPEMFYPERGARATTKAVVAQYCDHCPVLADCIEAGFDEVFGIWGGANERQRRKARKVAAGG